MNSENYLRKTCSCLLAPYSETVLHVASMAGFAKEVLRLKPEVSSILNKDRFAAIHLASSYGLGIL